MGITLGFWILAASMWLGPLAAGIYLAVRLSTRP